MIWEEDGKDTPGVWDGKWQEVDNARRSKSERREGALKQPLMYENALITAAIASFVSGARTQSSFPSP